MQPEFFPAPAFNVAPGIIIEKHYLPQAYLTADGKLLKIKWPNRSATYHLPETWMSVRFEEVSSAFYAAYGKEMEG